MADQPQQPQQPQTAATPRPTGPGAPRKSFVARLAASVASHAYMSLAIIVVLVILVIGVYVYYHGFLFLGPYAGRRPGRPASHRKKRAEAGADEGAGDADDRGDPETERLIESINRQ
jgi:hypothetical protein